MGGVGGVGGVGGDIYPLLAPLCTPYTDFSNFKVNSKLNRIYQGNYTYTKISEISLGSRSKFKLTGYCSWVFEKYQTAHTL